MPKKQLKEFKVVTFTTTKNMWKFLQNPGLRKRLFVDNLGNFNMDWLLDDITELLILYVFWYWDYEGGEYFYS